MTVNTVPQLAPHDRCTGCGACYNGCLKDAIHMVRDSEGFLYPAIGEGCVQCGHCSHICPVLKQREDRGTPAVFAAWSEDDNIRSQSTAGGVFTHLAEHVLEAGGVVFGAALDENLVVRHIAVKNTADLAKLRGSKLVQSDISESYQWVRLYLDQGRQVLFSGTPCQVDGLYRFLGEHPDQLLTCDILCHGVSSPGVWEKLTNSMAYVKQKLPVSVQFCSKLAGEKERRFRVTFSGGSTYDAPLFKSEFGRGLHRRLFLRPSCHNCPYTNTNRPGDLSLGLFQGLPKDFFPEEQKKGISLLLINSVKGAQLFDMLPLRRVKRTLDEAIAGNPALQTPAANSEERSQFFEALQQLPFQQVRQKFLAPVSHQYSKSAKSVLSTIKEKLWKRH